MKKLNLRLKKTDTLSLFHDSRGDVRVLAKALNKAIEKINELVEEINELKEVLNEPNT